MVLGVKPEPPYLKPERLSYRTSRLWHLSVLRKPKLLSTNNQACKHNHRADKHHPQSCLTRYPVSPFSLSYHNQTPSPFHGTNNPPTTKKETSSSSQQQGLEGQGGPAPTYVNSQRYRDPAGPHGKNLKEGGFEGSGTEAGPLPEPGSMEDPSRVATGLGSQGQGQGQRQGKKGGEQGKSWYTPLGGDEPA